MANTLLKRIPFIKVNSFYFHAYTKCALMFLRVDLFLEWKKKLNAVLKSMPPKIANPSALTAHQVISFSFSQMFLSHANLMDASING